jgi:CRP-like cAMP-binding protein/tRNA A-37 threonylcarbamoyl transferase component Bud32
MTLVNLKGGKDIIKQGDGGSMFYVLEDGSCDIYVNGTKVGAYEPGGTFGELALIYNAKRAATIRCTKDSVLWGLDISDFRRVLASSNSQKLLKRCEFLRNVPLLQSLSNERNTKIASALREVNFQDGQQIITQGDTGAEFYIIQAGRVQCTQLKGSTASWKTEEVDLLQLSQGEYFGEMALMLDEPRHAHVYARGPVQTLVLERDDFEELLGSLQNVLSAQMRTRILRSVPLLTKVSEPDLDKIARAMRVQQFDEGDFVIREGEEGSRFYIINEGHAEARVGGKKVGTLSHLDFFGERSLMKQEKRMADIVATSAVECLVLEQDAFRNLRGDVKKILEREIEKREAVSKGATQGAANEEGAAAAAAWKEIPYSDLKIMRTLGQGTFGRVKLVQSKTSKRVFALKCMQKQQIKQAHQERNIMNEKNILIECKHPLILELYQTYMNKSEIFMLMEMVQGGELWTYIYEKVDLLPRTRIGGFTNSASMFYAGCVVSALHYIHNKGVAYRDLKPENLLLDSAGYCKIIDFGFAKQVPFTQNGQICVKTYTICGTPDYLSPELIQSTGHDKSVDYWAFGCLVYVRIPVTVQIF